MLPTKQADWNQGWAGGSVDPVVAPIGEAVTVVAVSGAEVGWRGAAQEVGEHYPAPAPLPRLAAVDQSSTRLIESDGTDFGVFSSAREGWKSLSFSLPAGALAGCTGLRFSVRSDESYDGLVVRLAEGSESGVGGASGSVFSAKFDLVGDGAWHEIVLPFYGDGFRTGAFEPLHPLDAARVQRLSFVLPYHRSLGFALSDVKAFRAPVGDVPCPTVYPMVEVCDSFGDVRGERRQRSELPALARYEDLALQFQQVNTRRESASQALALGRSAQSALEAFAADCAREHSDQRATYSFARAAGAIRYALWTNQVELDRLAAWPEHPDGDLIWATSFTPDQYRDYPVEVASVAYWSEGLRVTGTLARPNRPGRYPLCLMNHGYGSFSKDHMIQVMRAASAGFVVLASDYRGQGESEGRQTRNAESSAAMARDVVNGARAVLGLPFVDPERVVMWGHSMGGGVSWNVLASEIGRRVRAYAQISSGPPRVSDERLRGLDCRIWLSAGGDEARAVAALPLIEETLRRIGLPFESKVFAGYSHHGMKYQASLAEALAFLRRYV